ncbi:hypothetical protein [Paraliomyxa miuraensis]|uniref:hypothetical protein n=1 Tax=Paraliomyxa miuraensis TaxID=376150 RepID=UPI00225704B3|nr:hypothetical protein [Paraliomyxa miuraensis]MCX4239832.1 hypothetical protein [Paraliomyxa miuraensis]
MQDLGLVTCSTDALRKLLRAVYKREVDCPLTIAALAGMGLQDHAERLLGHLRGLPSDAVHAVLVAALAERTATDEQKLKRLM